MLSKWKELNKYDPYNPESSELVDQVHEGRWQPASCSLPTTNQQPSTRYCSKMYQHEVIIHTSNKSSAVKLFMSFTPSNLAASQKAWIFSRWAKGMVDRLTWKARNESNRLLWVPLMLDVFTLQSSTLFKFDGENWQERKNKSNIPSSPHQETAC